MLKGEPLTTSSQIMGLKMLQRRNSQVSGDRYGDEVLRLILSLNDNGGSTPLTEVRYVAS
jgi:hypothetical protein